MRNHRKVRAACRRYAGPGRERRHSMHANTVTRRRKPFAWVRWPADHVQPRRRLPQPGGRRAGSNTPPSPRTPRSQRHPYRRAQPRCHAREPDGKDVQTRNVTARYRRFLGQKSTPAATLPPIPAKSSFGIWPQRQLLLADCGRGTGCSLARITMIMGDTAPTPDQGSAHHGRQQEHPGGRARSYARPPPKRA